MPPARARSCSLALTWLAALLSAGAGAGPQAALGDASELSAPAARVVKWTVSNADHAGRPFLVVDKRNARVHLLRVDGTLQASAPALLGAARGDHTVPGIGERPLRLIQPHERTTPAGRFEGEMGRNLQGEDVLWVDYDAAVSLHRVRAAGPAQRRLQRLASPTSTDNRISFGCINVPADFFDRVLVPAIGARTVIYVLPDTLPLEQVFPVLRATGSPAPAARGKGWWPRRDSPDRRPVPKDRTATRLPARIDAHDSA